MNKHPKEISGRECLLYTDGQPQVLLIQTLGGHEHNSIDTEVELIRKAVPVMEPSAQPKASRGAFQN